MSKYILITVNERKIFEPNYFETFNEAQKEIENRVKQIVEESCGKDCVEFGIDDGEAYVTDASFDKGDGNWDFVIVENKSAIPPKDKLIEAAQILVENGVDKDEAFTVLQAMCYVMMDYEIDNVITDEDEENIKKFGEKLKDELSGKIKDATFTSVWDGGFEITTNCKVNMESKEIFDIEVTDSNSDMVEQLDREYVTIDGIDYRAVTAEYANLYPEEMDEETFWYE